MVFSLHAYTTGKPESRSGTYFRGRMVTYSSVLAVAGLVQFLLGAWCQGRFEMNVLGEDGPVAVAFFIVTYPGISMYIGLLQMTNGVWGIVRAQDGENKNSNGNRNVPIYQLSLGFQWINVLILQDIVQIAYLPAGMLAPVAPFLACWSLGLTLMPAYLDHKMATLPEIFPKDYYYYGVAISDVEHDASSSEHEYSSNASSAKDAVAMEKTSENNV